MRTSLIPRWSGLLLIVLQNNLVRCSLGAACVSVIDLIIRAIGVGWTYVLLAGLCVLVGPSMFVIMYIGPRFRAKRRARHLGTQS